METKDPNKLLDRVLSVFVTYEPTLIGRSTPSIKMLLNLNNNDVPELIEILDKLVLDKYLSETLNNEFKLNDRNFYNLTFAGRQFIKNGGYVRQRQKDGRQRQITNVLLWSTGIGGGLTAIYYLLEIFKNYILPHCNCLYYTH